MKKYTIFNTVSKDVRTVTAAGLNRYMNKYKKQAREMLKRTNNKHVLYGILRDAKSDNVSCHVVALRPCSDSYLRRCFPASNRSTVPLIVSRR